MKGTEGTATSLCLAPIHCVEEYTLSALSYILFKYASRTYQASDSLFAGEYDANSNERPTNLPGLNT